MLWATEDLVLGGRPRPGLPIFLNGASEFIQPFQDYLIWKLIEAGDPLSPLTWEAYGRRIWDFVRYLEANGLRWNDKSEGPGVSPMGLYRDWMSGELRLQTSTVSGRLSAVREFYEWAFERKLVDRLPFTYNTFRRGEVYGERRSINLEPIKWTRDYEFNTVDELRAIQRLRLTTTQSLLFELIARVGLRSCEARTFPKKYVFDPASSRGSPGEVLRLRIDPRDMAIKFHKARVVDIPCSLMSRLYDYTKYERGRLLKSGCSSSLLVTTAGNTFTKSGVVAAFGSITRRVGFRVTALMLRHSYAIRTLMGLRADLTFKGDPLLYVRDRLGHESVETTMTYLRQIERLANPLIVSADDEIEAIFSS